MATLTGCRVPFRGLSCWDHTYVVSSTGTAWGCFGRDAGGEPMCQATADLAAAARLAGPESHLELPPVRAGLLYGVDGVCHQAANRILFCTGLTVGQARGYAVSKWLYGVYGEGWAPHLAQAGVTASARRAAAVRAEDPARFGRDDAIHGKGRSFALTVSAVFQLDLAACLGSQLAAADQERVLATHLDMLQAKAALDAAYKAGTLGALAYGTTLNSAVGEALVKVADMLDEASFTRLFGMPPAEQPTLIEVALMAS